VHPPLPEQERTRSALVETLKPFYPGSHALPHGELIGRVRALVGGRHPNNVLRGYTCTHAAIRRHDGSVNHLVVLTPPQGESIQAESADADVAFADAVTEALRRALGRAELPVE
jgi:hypothetical protein